MNTRSLRPTVFLAAASILLGSVAGAADETTNTFKFSDPSKPGTLKISLGRGELRVQGADTNEVTIKSGARPTPTKPRKDGLREIATTSSYAVKEGDNLITVDSGEWGGKGSADFRITVPRNTTLVVQTPWGGGNDIKCSNLSGDIDISSMHGEVQLEEVSGAVVVNTMNGAIRASIRELNDGKPISFTSMNGEVSIRLPETTKANIRLRTQNGSVLTDFEESALVTKSEAVVTRGKGSFSYRSGGKVLTTEIQEAIREATEFSATAVREALESVKEGLEAAKVSSEDARRELDKARREIDRARSEADRDRTRAEAAVRVEARTEAERGRRSPDAKPLPAPAVVAAPPMPPVAPGAWAAAPAKIAVPTITGGKLITGTLNGGGPEISIATMNGDVVLRKLQK